MRAPSLPRIYWVFLAVAAAALPGCHRKPHALPQTRPTSISAPEQTFADTATGARLVYPPHWESHASTAFVLLIAPPAVDPAVQSISLDVPDLPPHLPGFIPLGLVVGGYKDDLKKLYPSVVSVELPSVKAAGVSVRQVRSRWVDAGGKAHVERAALMVKNDHVLILRATSDSANAAENEAAFEQILARWTWSR